MSQTGSCGDCNDTGLLTRRTPTTVFVATLSRHTKHTVRLYYTPRAPAPCKCNRTTTNEATGEGE